MPSIFFLSFGFAILNWIAVARTNRKLELIAKPATLIALCVWFASYPAVLDHAIGFLLLMGLIFSLLGDVFLMLDDKHFLKGLIAFLLAHVVYIAAFNYDGPVIEPASLLILALIAIVAFLILRRLIASLKEAGRDSMVAPVGVYAAVLTLTLWSTVVTWLRPDWSRLGMTLAAVGGTLFFASDAAIAWGRFVGPHRGGRLYEMMTYHLAQFCLTSSILVYLRVTG